MNVAAGVARMLARLYAGAGSPLTFRNPVNQKTVSLQAIDRSSVLLIKEKSLDVSAVRPCCTVLRADLAAQKIDSSAMVDVDVTFAGANYRIMSVPDKPDPSWRVTNNQFKPVPNWQQNGEILFILMAL